MWPKKKKNWSRQSGCSRKWFRPLTLCRRNFTWFCFKIMRMALPLSECSLFERDQIDPRIEGYSTDWEHHPWIENRLKWSRRFVLISMKRFVFLQHLLAHFYFQTFIVPYGSILRGDQVIADFIKEDPGTLAHVLTWLQETFLLCAVQEAGNSCITFNQQVQDERDRWIPQVHWA